MGLLRHISTGFLVTMLALACLPVFADTPLYLRKADPAAPQNAQPPAAPKPLYVVPSRASPKLKTHAPAASAPPALYVAKPSAKNIRQPVSNVYTKKPAAKPATTRSPYREKWAAGLHDIKMPVCTDQQKKERDELERIFVDLKYEQIIDPFALPNFNMQPEGKRLRELVMDCGPNLTAKDEKRVQNMTEEEKKKIVEFYREKAENLKKRK